jgi:hypothetical protein
MGERVAVDPNPHNQARHARPAARAVDLLNSIIEDARDQQTDRVRIEDALADAEEQIAALQRRYLRPEESRRAVVAICERVLLSVRDLRRNMLRRGIAAQKLQSALDDDFLHECSRFAEDDRLDRDLRTRFFELLRRSPTFRLLQHFQEAVEAGNLACAEVIRFEFLCRHDRDEYGASFETLAARSALHDPVAIRKRLAEICNAAEEVDARLTKLLGAVRSSPGFEAAARRRH